MGKKVRGKALIVGCLSICFVFMQGTVRPLAAEAADLMQKLVYSAAAVTLITNYYNNLNTHGQKEMLANTQKQTGVYEDAEAKERIKSIEEKLTSSGLIKAKYIVYANPKKDFNAFSTLGHVISLNKGTLAALDDDELAAVVAHEIRHGEANHVVNGITKSISIGFIVDLYLSQNANNASYILSGIAGNYINNEMFTMAQEWEADNYAFGYVTAAGFNPGGPAAAMAKLKAQLGELWAEGLVRTINPNNHPKTSDRIHKFGAQLTEYSKGHVTVKNDKIVVIDGQEIVAPVKAFGYTPEERAYLIAGRLAEVYHKGTFAAVTNDETGSLYIGEQKIASLTEGDGRTDEITCLLDDIINKQLQIPKIDKVSL